MYRLSIITPYRINGANQYNKININRCDEYTIF